MYRGVRDIGTFFRRYYGFKCLVSVVLLTSLVTAFLNSARLQGLPGFGDLMSRTWATYIGEYWIHHLILLTVIVIFYVGLFYVDALEVTFEEHIPPAPPHPAEETAERRWRRATKVVVAVLWIVTLTTVPVLHLLMPKWLRIVAVGTPAVLTVLTYWYQMAGVSDSWALRPLARYHFPTTTSFNTASLAPVAREVRIELERYQARCVLHPRSESALTFLREGDAQAWWKGYVAFYQSLGRFLNVPPSSITAHQNTTQAVRRAVECSLIPATVILHTDLEFMSVRDELGRLATERICRRVELPLRHEHIAGNLMPEEVPMRIGAGINTVLQQHPATRRVVLVTSHVVFDTGVVLPAADIIAEVRTKGVEVISVVDGAQAVGNIEIPPAICSISQFYATSGHKWLLGKPAVGLLIHNPALLAKAQIPQHSVANDSIPYSSLGYEARNNDGGVSYNLEPIISLNAMLKEINENTMKAIAAHNAKLATTFASLAASLGFSVVTTPVGSGIVLLRLPRGKDAEKVRSLLETDWDMTCEAIGPHNLRFAFHYFMGSREVYAAIRALNVCLRNATVLRDEKAEERHRELTNDIREVRNELASLRYALDRED